MFDNRGEGWITLDNFSTMMKCVSEQLTEKEVTRHHATLFYDALTGTHIAHITQEYVLVLLYSHQTMLQHSV